MGTVFQLVHGNQDFLNNSCKPNHGLTLAAMVKKLLECWRVPSYDLPPLVPPDAGHWRFRTGRRAFLGLLRVDGYPGFKVGWMRRTTIIIQQSMIPQRMRDQQNSTKGTRPYLRELRRRKNMEKHHFQWDHSLLVSRSTSMM